MTSGLSRQWARVALFVLFATVFSLSVQGTEECLINGRTTAVGVEVAFDRPVQIIDYDQAIFSRVEPVGRATTFVFSRGSLRRGGGFRISWMPGTAKIESYEWITTASSVQGDSVGCTSARRAEARRLQEQADERQEEDPASAIELYREALVIYEACEDVEAQAICFSELGSTYIDVQNYEASEGAFLKARSLFQQLGAREEEAETLAELGQLSRDSGDYTQAISYYEESLELFEELDHRWGISRGWYRLGGCYLALGDYGRSLECFDTALGEAEPQSTNEAIALTALGMVYWELGDVRCAVEFFRESEAAMDEILDPGPAVAWYRDISQGDHFFMLGEYGDAIGAYTVGLDGARASNDPLVEWGAMQGLAGLGSCLVELGRFREALRYTDEALLIAHQLGRVSYEWRLLWDKGRAKHGLGQLEDAGKAFEEALQHVEEIRELVDAEEQRSSFLETARDLYVDYLRLLLEMHQPRETLQVAERSRARTFLDLVAAGPVGSLEDVDEAGIRTGAVEAAAIESDLGEVIADLPTDTAAMEYFVTDESTYVWVVRDGVSGEPIEVPIARSVLREQVVAFRSVLESSATGLSEMPDEATLAMSRNLYDLLVGPIADRLEGIEHLIIVPSGPLYYLPFCALLDCPGCEGADLLGGEYLIEQFSLSYAPSLTTLKYAWESAEGTSEEALFLALADPEVEDSTLPRLPDAQEEATAVAGLFDASEVYVDEEATEEVVGSRASSADQLLLSTHGTFNPVNPMFSYLLLSPTQESDGRLYTHEIFGLDLHTDLVTLSACETLLPALREMEDDVRAIRGVNPTEDVELSEELLVSLTAGDEIVGLTRALLYAGTPSVLSTLWSVVSETTEPLMVAFYEYLQQGFDKAEALRQAQRDVMEMYPHPRYWAAFELMGDWR